MGVEGLNSQILLCGPLCHTIYVWLDLPRRLGGGGHCQYHQLVDFWDTNYVASS